MAVRCIAVRTIRMREQYSYPQLLFRNDPQSKMGVLKVHFPDMGSYIFSSVRFMIPSLVFTLVLLITFIFTIVLIFRQKRYTEIKNDFINNMTHEPEDTYRLHLACRSDDERR